MAASKCAAVDRRDWGSYSTELWTRVATQLMLQGHVAYRDSVDCVDISRASSCLPPVWQARVSKDVKAGALELFPFVEGPLVLFKDGEKIAKRPERLHPSLPYLEVAWVASNAAHDSCKFHLKSPLAKSPLASVQVETAPAPYWCVIGAQKGDPAINMQRREFTVTMPTVTHAVAKQEKAPKKAKGLTLVLAVDGFVNHVPIKMGACLVVEEE